MADHAVCLGRKPSNLRCNIRWQDDRSHCGIGPVERCEEGSSVVVVDRTAMSGSAANHEQSNFAHAKSGRQKATQSIYNEQLIGEWLGIRYCSGDSVAWKCQPQLLRELYSLKPIKVGSYPHVIKVYHVSNSDVTSRPRHLGCS